VVCTRFRTLTHLVAVALVVPIVSVP